MPPPERLSSPTPSRSTASTGPGSGNKPPTRLVCDARGCNRVHQPSHRAVECRPGLRNLHLKLRPLWNSVARRISIRATRRQFQSRPPDSDTALTKVEMWPSLPYSTCRRAGAALAWGARRCVPKYNKYDETEPALMHKTIIRLALLFAY